MGMVVITIWLSCAGASLGMGTLTPSTTLTMVDIPLKQFTMEVNDTLPRRLRDAVMPLALSIPPECTIRYSADGLNRLKSPTK